MILRGAKSELPRFNRRGHTPVFFAAAAKSLQSCPTLSNPMDCSPPGSSVHGVFQARVLEWGAIRNSLICLEIPDIISHFSQ